MACAKILCVFPAPFASHQSVYQPIWKELLSRGHEVTVISPNPIRDLHHENLTQVDISFTYELTFETLRLGEVMTTEKNPFELIRFMCRAIAVVTEAHLTFPAVREAIGKNKDYDLVLVESAEPVWCALSAKFNCPLVGISSLEPAPMIHENIGNPQNVRLYPEVNLGFAAELSFFQTLLSFLLAGFVKVINWYYVLPLQQELAVKYIDKNTPDLLGIRRNISVYFVNVIPGFQKVRPNVPALIEVSGLHLKPKQELPEVLN